MRMNNEPELNIIQSNLLMVIYIRPRLKALFFQRTADGLFVLYRPQCSLMIPNGQLQDSFAELDRGPGYLL